MTDWSNLALIPCCFLIGIILRRIRVMPADAPVALNRFIIYISVPAITLNLLHTMSFGGQVYFPILMPWICFSVAVLFFMILKRSFQWDVKTLGALILTAGLGNTSFLGFPLIEAFYGKEGLKIGILSDQGGSFLVLTTLGILTATLCSGGIFQIQSVAKRVFTFPPFIAAIIALALRPIPYPAALIQMLDKLGATLVPLALVSVGMQLTLRSEHLREESTPLFLGLLYKLILGPALIALLYFKILGGSGRAIEISVFEAAMAPMITGGIVATQYGLNGRLASLMIGIGIPVSLITVPAWWWLISR